MWVWMMSRLGPFTKHIALLISFLYHYKNLHPYPKPAPFQTWTTAENVFFFPAGMGVVSGQSQEAYRAASFSHYNSLAVGNLDRLSKDYDRFSMMIYPDISWCPHAASRIPWLASYLLGVFLGPGFPSERPNWWWKTCENAWWRLKPWSLLTWNFPVDQGHDKQVTMNGFLCQLPPVLLWPVLILFFQKIIHRINLRFKRCRLTIWFSRLWVATSWWWDRPAWMVFTEAAVNPSMRPHVWDGFQSSVTFWKLGMLYHLYMRALLGWVSQIYSIIPYPFISIYNDYDILSR